jgi:hypothetical protein
LRFVPRCHDEEPLLTDQGPGHTAACHFPIDTRIIPIDTDIEEPGASP